MRKLKFHEKKLLKKVNLVEWKPRRVRPARGRRQQPRRGGRLQQVQRDLLHGAEAPEHCKANRSEGPFQDLDGRHDDRQALSRPRYNMGVIPTKKSLVKCEKLSGSAFCRQRLATVLVELKFAEHLKEAVTYIEQGHVRVDAETVMDPAFLVTRNMQDFITWVDTSKIK
uniref:Uncharacterized protein n=1 Tax=Avena sativa TaxID=4498 RepID=A0ACD5V3R2_AVESA